jgi:hypothetical protein
MDDQTGNDFFNRFLCILQCESEADKTKEISFKAKIPLAQMEEILNNEFDLLH